MNDCRIACRLVSALPPQNPFIQAVSTRTLATTLFRCERGERDYSSLIPVCFCGGWQGQWRLRRIDGSGVPATAKRGGVCRVGSASIPAATSYLLPTLVTKENTSGGRR